MGVVGVPLRRCRICRCSGQAKDGRSATENLEVFFGYAVDNS